MLSAIKEVNPLTDENVSRPQASWPCRYFSISLPFGEGQGDVAALLRHAADFIDRIDEDGEPTIIGLTYNDDEVNENGDWPSITVFYTLGE
nr:hypothetical protein OHB51_33520 [Micromonospora sp. NBC_00855]